MRRLAENTTDFSRKLRLEMTDAEKYLWRHLKSRQLHGLKFRRQHPLGNYILDFACIELKLAIEVDGGQHTEQQAYDDERTMWLKAQAWNVLRFWNNDVLQNIEGVLQVIETALLKHHAPSPS
ncbi:MAG: endonuclease domain-containing protein [Methylophilaceae bacterium]